MKGLLAIPSTVTTTDPARRPPAPGVRIAVAAQLVILLGGSDFFKLAENEIAARYRLALLQSLLNASQRGLASQDFQRFKKGRSVLATADRHANGLEHLSGFDLQLLRAAP